MSARTQYAIRAMVHLAMREGHTATAAEISAAEHIPAKYLEGIMSRLKLSALVDSERGKNGGYRLAGRPEDISMLAVIEAMDGSVRPVSCLGSQTNCSATAAGPSCLPKKFWGGLKEAIDAYLGSKTIRDVVEG
ncbi:MAG TPA: Rrf2 family transcriptional regulator [Spirochaetales bacterium]|nr:Rrf2 family transcriptional regulator [Spirochaetales bacterium]MBP7264015.1 Rrf2 family transcriptional regulator [Spirochaetia bacterium]HPE36641.1 Rrf2 family transcriptional regulator [Spirochaetales bacterium]